MNGMYTFASDVVRSVEPVSVANSDVVPVRLPGPAGDGRVVLAGRRLRVRVVVDVAGDDHVLLHHGLRHVGKRVARDDVAHDDVDAVGGDLELRQLVLGQFAQFDDDRVPVVPGRQRCVHLFRRERESSRVVHATCHGR